MILEALDANFTVTDMIGDQLLACCFVLSGDDHGIVNSLVFPQPCLDLPEFNPEASDFDLEVIAAQELDSAVRQPTGQVTGFIQAGVWRITERILDEAFCSEFGLVEICLLYTSPSPRDATLSRMPSSA